jgi:hypothetical protein
MLNNELECLLADIHRFKITCDDFDRLLNWLAVAIRG